VTGAGPARFSHQTRQRRIKFFFGPEWQHYNVWPDDADNRLRGTNIGLRMAGELWYEVTPLTP
jgi:hypothetical protein